MPTFIDSDILFSPNTNDSLLRLYLWLPGTGTGGVGCNGWNTFAWLWLVLGGDALLEDAVALSAVEGGTEEVPVGCQFMLMDGEKMPLLAMLTPPSESTLLRASREWLECVGEGGCGRK